jgi:iron(III) transport system permease protein
MFPPLLWRPSFFSSVAYSVSVAASMIRNRLASLSLLLFFLMFMLYPLSHVLLRAVVVDGSLSLHFFGSMLKRQYFRDVIANSLNLAIIVTTLTTLIAYPLAITLARYVVPGAAIIHALLMAPLVVPPFVGIIGVKQLLGRFGSVNLILLDSGLISHPISWLGGGNLLGIILLQTIHLVPILYLTISTSLRTTHISLEEAAMMNGASQFTILRRIVLPLSYPGWFAGAVIVFIASFTDLGTPLIFEYRKVLPVQIYDMLSDLNENPVGYSLVVFTCTITALLFSLSKSSRASESFASSSKLHEARRLLPLPRGLTVVACCILFLYCGVSLLPNITVVAVALSKEWFLSIVPQQLTLDHFAEVLVHPVTTHSLLISLCLSIAASVLTLIVGFATAYIVVRSRSPWRWVYELAALIPLAVPGIVFAFGYIGAFSHTILDNRINPIPLLIAAYTVRRFPQMVRSLAAGFEETSATLEEAASMVGAKRSVIMRRIVAPLMLRHIVAGAILTFAYSMIEVSDSLLLAVEERFYPVSKAIYYLLGRPDGTELASALGTIVMAMMLIAFYTAERISHRSDHRKMIKMGMLVLPFIILTHAHAQDSSSDASKSDELIVVSSHWEGIRSEFGSAFSDYWFAQTGRQVNIRWLDIGGTSDITKYLRSQFKSSRDGIGIDLMFGGGTDTFVELAHDSILEPIHLDPEIQKQIPAALGGVPLYSPRFDWFVAGFNTFGIVCNKVALRRLNLPEPHSWSDLAKPIYWDLIGAGDPRKSGSMHAMFEVILQGYGWERGWELIQRIAGNVRSFSGTASQIGKEVSTGDVICGLSIDTYAGDLIRRVGRDKVSYSLPSDYASVNGDGIAVIRGAPHRDVAEAFVNFTLSRSGQLLFYAKKGAPGGPKRFELGKLTILPALYGTVEPSTIVTDNPFTMQNLLPYDATTAASRWHLVNDLFGVSIIDVHERLVRVVHHGHITGVYQLPPQLLSQEQSKTLLSAKRWGSDPVHRNEYLSRWSQETFNAFPEEARYSLLKWFPVFLLSALWILRRFARRRRLLRRP